MDHVGVGLGAWTILLLASGGANLLRPTFWFSSDGVLLILAAGLPLAFLLAWRQVNERLSALHREQTEVNQTLLGFTEPTPGTSGNIVSIRHAVHRELTAFNEQLDRSLDRTSEIESVIRKEVGTLEQTFSENERRMLALVQEMARQRETLLAATDQVRDVVRENREALGNDLSSLSAEVLEAGNYARSVVEEVSVELKGELAAHGSQFARDLRQIVAGEIHPVSALLESQVRGITELVSGGDNGLVATLQAEGVTLVGRMEAAWTHIANDMAERTRQAEDAAGRLSGVIEESLGSNVNRIENLVERTSLQMLGAFDGAAEQTAQRFAEIGHASSEALDAKALALSSGISAQLERLETLIEGGADRLVPALEKHNAAIERAIGLESAFEQSTSRLGGLIESGATTLSGAAAAAGQQVEQAGDRFAEGLGALSRTFAGEVDTFTALTRSNLDAAGRDTLAEIERRMSEVHAAFNSGLTPAYDTLEAGCASSRRAWASSMPGSTPRPAASTGS